MDQRTKRLFEERPERRAALSQDGEEQKPTQSGERSSSLWDTEQHSRAPGPFGTGGADRPDD